MEEEKEFSILFSVPSSIYTRLLLILASAPENFYTRPRKLIKNVYDVSELEKTKYKHPFILRTIQDDNGFLMQRKWILKEMTHKHIYKYMHKNYFTLFLNVNEKHSIEEVLDVNNFSKKNYYQILRDFIYCRRSGIRISIERKFIDYIDEDVNQLQYDCFNRYKFECFIHIEWEQTNISKFLRYVCTDTIMYKLFVTMATKNMNYISDEIINIKNMTLVHNYDNTTFQQKKNLNFYALKFDGVRKNFCIFNKYIQIDRMCFEFKNHQFGQIIIGHCEVVGDLIILIDIYLVTENYHKIAKTCNVSFTSALQTYHSFCNSSSGPTKSQDEFFHMKRLKVKINYLNPIEAIEILNLLQQHVWNEENSNLTSSVKIQIFYKDINQVYNITQTCSLPIDGVLGFSSKKIYKIKQKLTIDLLFHVDEMFRYIVKKIKINNDSKLIKFLTIQKTLNWREFECKYPQYFNKIVGNFLFFGAHKNFNKLYPDWRINIDVAALENQIENLNCTLFVILIELEIDVQQKLLTFTRIRNDKFSANSVKIFKNIIKQI